MPDYSIEKQVAADLAHRERVAKTLAETGGEVIHPDHYKFREDFRSKTLAAMDEACDEHSMLKVTDGDLPILFRTLDALADILFRRSKGL